MNHWFAFNCDKMQIKLCTGNDHKKQLNVFAIHVNSFFILCSQPTAKTPLMVSGTALMTVK